MAKKVWKHTKKFVKKHKKALIIGAVVVVAVTVVVCVAAAASAAAASAAAGAAGATSSSPDREEKARTVGSILAHETLDGISDLASIAPQLLEEIKDIGNRIAPEILSPPSYGELTPLENYETLMAAGHEKIDETFSTDLAERYTPESKASKNDKFTVGILPPPASGFFGKSGWELKNPKFQPTKNTVSIINGRT